MTDDDTTCSMYSRREFIAATGKSIVSATIASLLANQFLNADTDAELHAMVYTALILLVITMLINGAARVILMRVTRPRQQK